MSSTTRDGVRTEDAAETRLGVTTWLITTVGARTADAEDNAEGERLVEIDRDGARTADAEVTRLGVAVSSIATVGARTADAEDNVAGRAVTAGTEAGRAVRTPSCDGVWVLSTTPVPGRPA